MTQRRTTARFRKMVKINRETLIAAFRDIQDLGEQIAINKMQSKQTEAMSQRASDTRANLAERIMEEINK